MQKARRLSAAALWSRSFNPLHLSSLPPPPPPLLTSLPLQSASFTSLLLLHDPLCVASSIFPFSSHVGCNPTLLLFMELPQLFPLQPRPNLSNKSFNLQISTTGKDQQAGRGNLRSRKCWTKGKKGLKLNMKYEDSPHTLYQKETSFQTRPTKWRILNKMLPNLRNLPTSN